MIYVARYALVVVYTVFWGILACLAAPFDRSGNAIEWIGRRWMGWILASCGIRIEVSGLENVDPSQAYVFMTNHQSVVDVAAIGLTLPVHWRFVAKRELTWIPFFGWALGLSQHVIIDRGRNERAVRSLHRAARRIRDGTNVIIFPEGTRSPTGQLQPFKSGGFHLAIEAQVPILPATVSGSQQITPKGSFRIESGTVKIVYGKPIEARGLTVEDRQALKERVRSAILAGYDPDFQKGRSVARASHAARQGRSPA